MKKITCSVLAISMLLASYAAVPSTEPTTATPPTAEEKAKMQQAVADATASFHALSKQERKLKMKEVKAVVKKHKADKKAGKTTEANTVLLAILAILLPPLAVYLKNKEINTQFWISLVLTLLFIVPGIIYALLVVLDVI